MEEADECLDQKEINLPSNPLNSLLNRDPIYATKLAFVSNVLQYNELVGSLKLLVFWLPFSEHLVYVDDRPNLLSLEDRFIHISWQ